MGRGRLVSTVSLCVVFNENMDEFLFLFCAAHKKHNIEQITKERESKIKEGFPIACHILRQQKCQPTSGCACPYVCCVCYAYNVAQFWVSQFFA